MFWKGKVPFFTQLYDFLKLRDLTFANELAKPVLPDIHDISIFRRECKISVASIDDCRGISSLLNKYFERADSKTETAVTAEWVRSTFLQESAIWIVAKDIGGTIRGCVTSFRTVAPYPNSLAGCGLMYPWGIVDWFCVDPLWRGKGVSSRLLETLDFITYRIGRKAHIFLKEGVPLPLPHVPIYVTQLRCRKAGSDKVKQMREGTGLTVYLYNAKERATGLPLIRIEGLEGNVTDEQVNEWETALDTELPKCWVFINGASRTNSARGWQSDSLVSMYAFRWNAGKWLGSRPNSEII